MSDASPPAGAGIFTGLSSSIVLHLSLQSRRTRSHILIS
jgi:hypothetical protein